MIQIWQQTHSYTIVNGESGREDQRLTGSKENQVNENSQSLMVTSWSVVVTGPSHRGFC